MLNKFGQNAQELFLVQDEEPVKALAAYGADEALGNGVHVGRVRRGADGLNAVWVKIEELAAVVVNHAYKVCGFFNNLLAEQHDLLANEVANGVLCDRELNNLPRFMANNKVHVVANSGNGVDGEEVHFNSL